MGSSSLSALHSKFLLDVSQQFALGGTGFPRAKNRLDLIEKPAASLLEEWLEVIAYVRVRELYVYQTLVLWGDHVATYSVRENVKKRQDRLVFELRDFPLSALPLSIVKSFWWAYFRIKDLNVPPGRVAADQDLLRGIGERWMALSCAHAH
jgi:hypothetical protein